MEPSALVAIAVAQAVLLTLGVALLIGHAAFMAARERSDRERLREARATVGELLDGADPDGEPPPAIARLSMREQIRLFGDLARSLDGERRRRLARLAGRAGLLARAERWCRRRRWWWRLRGARLLTALGAGGQEMLDLFDDRRPEVRAQAAEWAAGHPGPEPVERLLGLLEDDRTLCRFTVKDSLLRLGPAASAPVAAYLDRQSGARAREALEVATGLADARFLGPALIHADSDDPGARAGAAALLAAIGGERTVHRLLALLDDADPAVRAAAAQGLGRLGHWPAAASLYEQLGDPAWAARRAAALALRRLGPAGVVMLRRAREHPDRYARDMARQVLELPAAPALEA